MSDTAPRTHHEFSPSQLKYLDLCPGRWRMCKIVPPQPQSPAAAEGEMLHEIVEKLYPVHPGVRAERDTYKGLTDEQKLLVDKTLELLDKMELSDCAWVFEEELSITDDDFNVVTSGYVDAYCFDAVGNGIIVDFKFGFSPVDPAEGNTQLKVYAKALLDKYGLAQVTVCIWQPRVSKFSKHTYTAADLEDVVDWIKGIEARCKGNALVLNPNDDSCRFCPAKSICPAFNAKPETVGNELVKIEHTHELTTEKLSEYLTVADTMEAQWKEVKKKIDSLRHTALEHLLKNESVPGWTLETERGDREVRDANGVFGVCNGVIPQEEFMALVKLPVTKLEKLYATSKKKASGGTLAEAEREFKEKTKDFIGRKQDSQKLVRIETQTPKE